MKVLRFALLAFLALELAADAAPQKFVVQRGLEIRFKHAEGIQHELPWIFERPLAMHPSGRKIAALIPQAHKTSLRRETGVRQPRRTFQLCWIDVDTGTVGGCRELEYRHVDAFGINISPRGAMLCTVADGHVLILDENFQTLARLPAHPQAPNGKTLNATACSFFSDGGPALVAFKEGLPWNATNLLILWDWVKGHSAEYPIEGYLESAAAISEETFILVRLLPNWMYRYEIGEYSYRTPDQVVWKSVVHENGCQRSLATENHVFVGDFQGFAPADELLVVSPPGNLPDLHDPPPAVMLTSSDGDQRLCQDERIRSWQRGTGKEGRTYGRRGFVTHWPVAVSANERWLAARLTKFEGEDRTHNLRWSDNRFAIFRIEQRTGPIHSSDTFGRAEAITGMAFTPDSSKLIVSTSHRLVTYDLKVR